MAAPKLLLQPPQETQCRPRVASPSRRPSPETCGNLQPRPSWSSSASSSHRVLASGDRHRSVHTAAPSCFASLLLEPASPPLATAAVPRPSSSAPRLSASAPLAGAPASRPRRRGPRLPPSSAAPVRSRWALPWNSAPSPERVRPRRAKPSPSTSATSASTTSPSLHLPPLVAAAFRSSSRCQ
nr:mucin-7-like [Aegilops tauschii subsp. strangulata]